MNKKNSNSNGLSDFYDDDLDELSDFSDASLSFGSSSDEFNLEVVSKTSEASSLCDGDGDGDELVEEKKDDGKTNNDKNNKYINSLPIITEKKPSKLTNKRKGPEELLKELNDSETKDQVVECLETLSKSSIISLRAERIVSTIKASELLINNLEDSKIANLVCSILHDLAYCDSNKTSLVECGTISLLIEIINNQDDEENILYQCIELLCQLAHNADTRKQLSKENVIQTVVPLMKGWIKNLDIQATTCRLLQLLSFDDGNTGLILSSGGLYAVMQALGRYCSISNTVLINGCGVLYFMIFEIEKLGEDNLPLVEDILRVVCNISKLGKEIVPMDTVRHAIAVLQALVSSQNEKILISSTQAGAVQAAIDMVNQFEDDTEIFGDGMNILYTIITNERALGTLATIHGSDGLQNIISALKHLGGVVSSNNNIENVDIKFMIQKLKGELYLEQRDDNPETEEEEEDNPETEKELEEEEEEEYEKQNKQQINKKQQQQQQQQQKLEVVVSPKLHLSNSNTITSPLLTSPLEIRCTSPLSSNTSVIDSVITNLYGFGSNDDLKQKIHQVESNLIEKYESMLEMERQSKGQMENETMSLKEQLLKETKAKKDLQFKVDQQESAINQLDIKLRQIQLEFSEKDDTLRSLMEGNDIIQQENESLVEKNKLLEQKVDLLKQTNSAPLNKKKEERLESRIKELESENSVLETKHNELKSKNNDLESKNNVLETKNNELKSKNNDLESKNNDLESENSYLESQISDLQLEKEELQQELETTKEEIRMSNTKVDAQDEVKNLQKELKKNVDEKTKLQNENEDLSNQIKKLTDDIGDLNDQLVELRGMSKTLQSDNVCLQEENMALEKERESKSNLFQDEILSLKEQISCLQAENKSYQHDVNSLQQKLDNTDYMDDSDNSSDVNERSKIDALEKQILALQDDSSLQDEISNLKEALAKERLQRGSLEGELKSLRIDKQHSDQSFDQLEHAMKNIQDLEHEIKHLKQEEQRYIDTNTKLEEKITSLSSKINDQAKEIATYRNHAKQQEENENTLLQQEKRIEMTRSQLESEYKMVVSAMSASKARLEDRLDKAETDRLKLQAQVSKLSEIISTNEEEKRNSLLPYEMEYKQLYQQHEIEGNSSSKFSKENFIKFLKRADLLSTSKITKTRVDFIICKLEKKSKHGFQLFYDAMNFLGKKFVVYKKEDESHYIGSVTLYENYLCYLTTPSSTLKAKNISEMEDNAENTMTQPLATGDVKPGEKLEKEHTMQDQVESAEAERDYSIPNTSLFAKEKKPLTTLFTVYAKRQRDGKNVKRSSLDRRTKVHQMIVGMSFDGLLQFCTDFEVVPQLYGRSELRGLFNTFLSQRTLTLEYNGWVKLLEKVATTKFPGQQIQDQHNSTIDFQVSALLQWMDSSDGKTKLWNRNRSGGVIRKFHILRMSY